VFRPSSRLAVFNDKELHETLFLYPRFGLSEVGAYTVANQLSAKVSSLLAHKVILVNALTQPSGTPCSSSPESLTWATVSNVYRVNARALRQSRPNAAVEL